MAEITIEIPDGAVPKGFDAVALRLPANGDDAALDNHGQVHHKGQFYSGLGACLILRKKPPVYREPTHDDAGRMVEVRNFLDRAWERPRELVGILVTDEGRQVFVTRDPGPTGHLYQWRLARLED